MDRFLNTENIFFTGVTKVVLLIVINALFLIGCIPLFTIGASYSALYYTINKNLKFNRGYTLSCYWDSFKENFKQSTVATLIILAISAVLLGDVAVIYTFAGQGKINEGYAIFFLVILAIVWIYAMWIFAYIAMFKNDLKSILQNGIKLLVVELPTTIYVVLIAAFVAFLIWVLWPVVFIMPAVGVWLITMRMQRSFRKYMTDEQRAYEDELNDMKVYDDSKL